MSSRPAVVALVTVLLVAAPGFGGVVLADQTGDSRAQSPTVVTECMVVDESGRYVLGSDVSNATAERCIVVTASDVILDGQGHRVRGSLGSADESLPAGVGVRVEGPVENVTVRNLTSEGWGTDVLVHNASDVTLDRVTGVHEGQGTNVRIVNSTGVTVVDSAVPAPPTTGLQIAASSDVLVDNLTAGASGVSALAVRDSENVAVRGSHMRDGARASVAGSRNVTFRNNTLYTLDISGSGDVLVAGNDVRSERYPERGIAVTVLVLRGEIVAPTGNVTVVGNRITGHEVGVFVSPFADTGLIEIRDNVIADNEEYGVRNENATAVDARGNDWGAANGPSSPEDPDAPFADPVTGALADGEGSAVSESPTTAGEANVCFDPHRTGQATG